MKWRVLLKQELILNEIALVISRKSPGLRSKHKATGNDGVSKHKATANDGVRAKLLRIAVPAIADSLCKLINF